MKRNLMNSSIKFCDITLRDGLQSLKYIMPTKEKIKLADYIYHTYRPFAMEIGSIVSPKILPQFEDSIEIFKHCKDNKFSTKLYMLTPNTYALEKAKAAGVKNFAFISSVSDAFQLKNTNKTIDENRIELTNMYKMLEKDDTVKIYISCIDECPIKGKIPLDDLIFQLYFYLYNFSHVNEICLSDTCGTLNENTFNEIINDLKGNIDFSQLSLHLHKSKNNSSELFKIIECAKNNNINRFDVSAIDNIGGCSVSIKDKLPSNIHYKDIDEEYDFFKKYMDIRNRN